MSVKENIIKAIQFQLDNGGFRDGIPEVVSIASLRPLYNHLHGEHVMCPDHHATLEDAAKNDHWSAYLREKVKEYEGHQEPDLIDPSSYVPFRVSDKELENEIEAAIDENQDLRPLVQIKPGTPKFLGYDEPAPAPDKVREEPLSVPEKV